MDVNTFSQLIHSESAARKFLLGFCWKNHQRSCPRCRNRKLYALKEGRRRCAKCGYTFHDFSRRFINIGQLTCLQWLWIVKFYELETPPATIAIQLGLSRNTVNKALLTVRQAISNHALDAPQLLELGLLKGASADNPPVFGLLERRNWAFVDIMQDIDIGAVAHFRNSFHLRMSRQGRVIYTDRYRHYDTLVFCVSDTVFLEPFFGGALSKSGGVYVDQKQGFWSFLKERMRRSRGLSSQWFPLYLKEMEFRYNHRNDDIFEIVCRYLCSFVPDLA